MRIDSSASQSVSEINRPPANRNVNTQPPSDVKKPSTSNPDHVNLSDSGSLLSLAKNTSADKVGKVAELASQYRAGRYTPDVEALSQRIAVSFAASK